MNEHLCIKRINNITALKNYSISKKHRKWASKTQKAGIRPLSTFCCVKELYAGGNKE
jgi:hypothetical protein